MLQNLSFFSVLENRPKSANRYITRARESAALQEINNQLATMTGRSGRLRNVPASSPSSLDDLRDEIRQLTAAVAADK